MPLTLNLHPEESRLPSPARSLMRKLTKLFSTCVALAVTLSPAYAAQLYVPLTNYPGDGTTLEIVVTNPDTVGPHLRGRDPRRGHQRQRRSGDADGPGHRRARHHARGEGAAGHRSVAPERPRRARGQRPHARSHRFAGLSGRRGADPLERRPASGQHQRHGAVDPGGARVPERLRAVQRSPRRRRGAKRRSTSSAASRSAPTSRSTSRRSP